MRLPSHRFNIGIDGVHRLNATWGKPESRAIATQMTVAGWWLSSLNRLQQHLWRDRLSQASVDELVVIVGHWRSGTTLLHELLALDRRFGFPSTHACMNPHHFLLTAASPAGARKTPFARPMDGMAITPDSPQEDEFALLCLGQPSPYEAALFPSALAHLVPLCDTAAWPADQRDAWISAFDGFLRKVAAQSGQRRLVLKSPSHSFRVRLIAGLKPQSRFIQIVRDPAATFASSVQMWRILIEAYAVVPSLADDALQAAVLATLDAADLAVDSAVAALPARRFARVYYEDLIADPVGQIGRLYETLELGDFEPIRPALVAECERRRPHRGSPRPLDRHRAEMLAERCSGVFHRHGYALPTESIRAR